MRERVRRCMCGSVGRSDAHSTIYFAHSSRSARGKAVRLVVCELCDNLAVWAPIWHCGAVRQCVAVRAAVCGSARGSVRQCVAVRLWQCVAVR
jgi:hypothetical protein